MLDRAQLQDATLARAHLQGASLNSANLQRSANFYLSRADDVRIQNFYEPIHR